MWIEKTKSKLKKHRWLRAIVTFVLFWILWTTVVYLAANIFGNSDLVWSLRPYIWAFVGYALLGYAIGGFVISIFLVLWVWLNPEKPRHKKLRKVLKVGVVVAVFLGMVGVGIGLVVQPINEEHLLLQYFVGRRDFRDLNMSAWSLPRAGLAGIDFSGADLSDTDLMGADLTGSNLDSTNLSRADLSYADLIQADLGHSNLAGANLLGVDLTSVDLIGFIPCHFDRT